MKVEGIFGGVIEVAGQREHEVDQLVLHVSDPNNLVLDSVSAAALGAALTQWAAQVPAKLTARSLAEDRNVRVQMKRQGLI